MSRTEPPPERAEPREVELKLGLPTTAAYLRLRGALDAAGGLRRVVRQENLYFDGADGELSGASISVRVRVERAEQAVRTLLTVKAASLRRGEIMERAEWECALALDVESLRADPSRLLTLDLDPVRTLRRLSPDLRALCFLGGITNERRVYRVALRMPAPGDSAGDESRPPDAATPTDAGMLVETTWELDRAAFPDGSIDHELEVELGGLPCGTSATAAVAAIRAELARLGVPTVAQLKTKQMRFRERIRR